MSPQKKEKNPIKVIKYRAGINIEKRDVDFSNVSFLKIRYKPNTKTNSPWPISPNMTPKRKGNVIIVNTLGLISLYLGIP